MKILSEFFEDSKGEGSMTRFIMFGTWFIASIIMLWLTKDNKMSEGYFTMYLGIPAIAYGHSKMQEVKAALGGVEQDIKPG